MIIKAGQTATNQWGDECMPLSVKGIVEEDGKIWLRKNEWGKWELPGGRLEAGEQPEQTVVREIEEELGLKVKAQYVVDVQVWRKDFGNNPVIGIVTFACQMLSRSGELELIGEAGPAEFAQFSPAEALALEDLPDIYKRAIQAAGRENK
jgi:8-oxo-dGTP pyrophosphatase MutT (NUDIX family)